MRVAVSAAAATAGLALAGCALAGTAASAGAGRTAPAASGSAPAASGSASGPAGRSATAVPRSAPPAHPLAGKVVGIDPGHNGLNYTDPAFLNKQIWDGRRWQDCNTTGTQTAAGYPEPRFTFRVAMFLAADLRAAGAKVALTRHDNHGVGPCVNRRAAIIDRSGASVAIDIHADGGPAWGRGFTVLEPVADGINNKVIAPSLRFGRYVHASFIAHTALRPSDYYGHNGYIFRDDLAGLNLTTVPEVLIECGNMPNRADAAVLTSPAGQRTIARALYAAIVRFLTGRWPAGAGR